MFQTCSVDHNWQVMHKAECLVISDSIVAKCLSRYFVSHVLTTIIWCIRVDLTGHIAGFNRQIRIMCRSIRTDMSRYHWLNVAEMSETYSQAQTPRLDMLQASEYVTHIPPKCCNISILTWWQASWTRLPALSYNPGERCMHRSPVYLR